MAFLIKLKSGSPDVREVKFAIERAIPNSRFQVGEITMTGRGHISIRTVRLRKKKGYCGNHPGACVVPSKHKKRDFMEGVDWVEFNDLLNDVMDQMHVNADAGSSHVIIRKGKMRCVEYTSHFLPPDYRHSDWDKDSEQFEDWCGRKAGRSRYPEGTPGGEEEAKIQERLEYLRGELKAERISYGEIAELQSLVDHIEPSDVELLEAAGVPEESRGVA